MALRRKTPLKRGTKRLAATTRIKAVNPERRKRRRDAYNAFIRSKAWKEQRARVLARDDHLCTRCGSESCKPLQAHHLRYRHPLHTTPDTDLVTLGKPCHELVESELRPWNRGRYR